jgi:hypothetical protein
MTGGTNPSKTSLLTSAGSGTASSNGQQGGHGLGKVLRPTSPRTQKEYTLMFLTMVKMWLAIWGAMIAPMYMGLGANPALKQFKAEQAAADSARDTYGDSARQEGATLNPFLSQEMKAQHLYNPTQTNELLTAAEAGSGGAIGGAEGLINANAARTGNATTLTKTLDEMARDRAKASAGASEGIAAQDVMGAKQLNQEGAAGMQGLYGTNVSGQLGAMKSGLEATQGEMQANKGWFNNLTQNLANLGTAASGAMSVYKGIGH